jgi:hypothetical protein
MTYNTEPGTWNIIPNNVIGYIPTAERRARAGEERERCSIILSFDVAQVES